MWSGVRKLWYSAPLIFQIIVVLVTQSYNQVINNTLNIKLSSIAT